MNTSWLLQFPRPYLTDAELNFILGGTIDSCYSKTKRLVAKGQLIHIRRGLYQISGHPQALHPYALAEFIYGPSYISLESALSFHRLIPEAVCAITSVCVKRTKTFKTNLGIFSYHHLPENNFYTGVELIQTHNSQFFMAKPWKAICDYIYCYKKNWTDMMPLYESLRIDPDALEKPGFEEIQALKSFYNQKRITRFLKGLAV